MEFHEKFLISLLSKRARNTLKLTSVPSEFQFHLGRDLQITPIQSIYERDRFEGGYCIGGEEMWLIFKPKEVISLDGIEKHLLLTAHVLDTFSISSITMTFLHEALPSSAWQLMKIINQRQANVRFLLCLMKTDSSEFLPRFLDECTEVTGCIRIPVCFPDVFVFTPSRPFKTREFRVKGKCDWLNIDSLINCRIIQLEFRKTSNRTAKCWKRFFDNWKNGLSLSCYGESEYEVMIGGLIDGGTETEIECLLSEVKRRDGSEFMVKGYTGFHVMPKQAYLEYMKREDLYYSIQTPPI
uniref:FBA_2 domain-containing protein n=1 Tax=Caenorhabditis tropicalis TaxID=1561998 RepID=A0A1I7UTA6_9PELO